MKFGFVAMFVICIIVVIGYCCILARTTEPKQPSVTITGILYEDHDYIVIGNNAAICHSASCKKCAYQVK
jgi:hypothetical protein